MIPYQNIPLSLYIHLPWCIKKCPYCDFNSYTQNGDIPETAYIDALLQDFDQDVALLANRPIVSIFIGGGTPSLFSPQAIKRLLCALQERVEILPHAEITMEANPGTFEQARFEGFRTAGVNRLSLGVQSFNATHLQKLGRIHGKTESLTAVSCAQKMGFDAINIDLMYALPNQSVTEALEDLAQGCDLKPAHLSWYHLTIEPNTAFYRRPPITPNEEITEEIETLGRAMLSHNGFENYEVSAFAQANKRCVHNVNYWEFGDYLGIGAGAHSKITLPNGDIQRFWKHKVPHQYLDPKLLFTSNATMLSDKDRVFEFMLNAMRLTDGFSVVLFEARTGVCFGDVAKTFEVARGKGLVELEGGNVVITLQGKRFLDDLVGMFLG